jgi:hypothetical protein
MKFNEEDELGELNDPSLTGPNELNEEDLGLDQENEFAQGEDDILDDESDTMEDPDNDLDEDEVDRLFPGDENPSKDGDLDELNESV